MKKPCIECPWVVRNKNNDNFIEHSKRHNKKHNCHMKLPKDGGVWEIKEDNQCTGNKNFLNNVTN